MGVILRVATLVLGPTTLPALAQVSTSKGGGVSTCAIGMSIMGGSGMMGEDDVVGDPDQVANAADKAFIEAMIPHYQTARMMAQMLPARSEKPALQHLVQSIITSRSAEIAQMCTGYQQWYGTTSQ